MRVLLIDDDPLVCVSLKTILEAEADIEIAAMGHDGSEAIRLYEEHTPDILLMDIRMRTMNGLDAARQIFARSPSARILFLTTFSDDEYIIRALAMGAKGYILKERYESIVPALRAVLSGQSVYGDDIMTRIPSLLGAQSASGLDGAAHGLTERELELIEGIAQGLSNREISASMHLSEGTVRNYLSAVLEKLELRDRTQLAIFYYKNRG